MLINTILAFIKLRPISNTVHRLGTAFSGALLIGIGIGTAIAIVSSIGADGIGSAAPVLVVIAVMEARAIGTPVSNTVHRLAAAVCRAINLVVCMRTFLTIEIVLCGDLVGSAALVLVTISNMIAAGKESPLTNTVHRLTATILRALLKLILMRTSKSIVQGNLANIIESATLVLVTVSKVVALIINAPSSNTIHRLGTLLSGALLKVVGIWASISTVGRCNRDLVQSAALVVVCFLVVVASSILVPTSDTVDRLSAKLGAALNIAVSIWTGIATV